MAEVPGPAAELNAPRSQASRMAEPRVREEASRTRASIGKLEVEQLRGHLERVVQVLEDAIELVILAAHADADASDLAAGRMEQAACDAVLNELHGLIDRTVKDHLLQSQELAAFEVWPRLLLIHTELRALAGYVRFEQTGQRFIDGLRVQHGLAALMLAEVQERREAPRPA